ncbi:Precursor of CEP15 [Hirschfeldia incana]|nr:Precursor of CEP15 [Hirschfeldia incana]
MDARKINLHVLLLSFLLISEVPSILGLTSTRGNTRSETEVLHGGEYVLAMKSRKLMATNLKVDYSGDYDDGASLASPSPPVPDYDDDIYKRQGDVPSPGIGH